MRKLEKPRAVEARTDKANRNSPPPHEARGFLSPNEGSPFHRHDSIADGAVLPFFTKTGLPGPHFLRACIKIPPATATLSESM